MKKITDRHREHWLFADAMRDARRYAEMRGESYAVVERTIIVDHSDTYHDATAYGTALGWGVEPWRIVAWAHPHGLPPISDERMTALYAAELAEQRLRETVAS